MSQHSLFTAPTGTLERELADVLRASRLDERQASAVAARLGWDGRGASTLQQAALAVGYTRERVRQLEASFRDEVPRDHYRLPLLDRALRAVEECAPDACSHVGIVLQERGISGAPFDPTGVLSAAGLFDRPTSASIRRGLVEVAGAPAPTRTLVANARKLVSARGAAAVVDLARASGVEPARARRLLELVPDVIWLDEQRSWIGLRVPNTRRRLDGILRKMLAVGGRLTLTDAEEGLRRSYRPVVLPPAILRSLYDGMQWLDVDARRGEISTEIELDRSRVLSPVEERLAAMFVDHGPTLAFAQAVELGTEIGLNRNTVGYYLTHAPVIKTVRPGRYALRGAAAYEPVAA